MTNQIVSFVISVSLALNMFASDVSNITPWQVGETVAPEMLTEAQSLSAGRYLDLDSGKVLFFSNMPELPKYPGFLTRADNVVAQNGVTRVLYSHFNLLIGYHDGNVVNIPGEIGIVFTNNTNRTIDVYHKRWAHGVSVLPNGTRIYKDDQAPLKPGTYQPIFYGTQLGNAIMSEFFTSNPTEEEIYWTTIKPGEVAWLYDEVGRHGWAIGMGDFVFRNHADGSLITKSVLGAGEQVGISSFICKLNDDLEKFYQSHSNSILAAAERYEVFHMRGTFEGGITRKKEFTYDSFKDGVKSITLNVGQRDQNYNPEAPFYQPDMFLNDVLTNGVDAYSAVKDGQGVAVKADNNGSYGTDYEFTFRMTGPTAIVLQAANPTVPDRPAVDLYNQFLTAMLDNDPNNVRTLQFIDPHYFEYYTNPEKMGQLGSGRVAYTFPSLGEKVHTLKIGIPPNSYGCYKVVLMPLYKVNE